jgi:hypothetical protein
MGRRTSFAARLGAPLGRVAPKIVQRSSTSLGATHFPAYPNIVLSCLRALPQIGYLPIDFAGAFAGSAPRNRLCALRTDDRSPSHAQETGNFRL